MLTLFGDEQVYRFRGAYHHDITLKLFPKKTRQAGHVVVLALFKNQLLFTQHQKRGLEWPGGKVEQGEIPLAAAIRELHEETGGIASSMWFVGQYEAIPTAAVSSESFIKNIYVAQVQEIEPRHSGKDTLGPALFPIHLTPSADEGFSPLVLDNVFDLVRRAIVLNIESYT